MSCDSTSNEGYLCTLEAGHVGLHWAEGAEGKILAYWTSADHIAQERSRAEQRRTSIKPLPAADADEPRLAADKFDDGKAPMSLVPPEALEEVARVFGYGARKYAPGNHRRGFRWSRLLDSALRHLVAFSAGEDDDPESGRSHLAHAACQILMLLDHALLQLGEDDRWTRSNS